MSHRRPPGRPSSRLSTLLLVTELAGLALAVAVALAAFLALGAAMLDEPRKQPRVVRVPKPPPAPPAAPPIQPPSRSAALSEAIVRADFWAARPSEADIEAMIRAVITLPYNGTLYVDDAGHFSTDVRLVRERYRGIRKLNSLSLAPGREEVQRLILLTITGAFGDEPERLPLPNELQPAPSLPPYHPGCTGVR
jgi:hypothetical protein